MAAGDPTGCGLIITEVHDGETNLGCNECGTILRTVATSNSAETLANITSNEMRGAICPSCGAWFVADRKLVTVHICFKR